MVDNTKNPLQQDEYFFVLPEALVSEEARDISCSVEEDGLLSGAVVEDRRPWYRRPSAQCMLFLISVSAMSSAGMSPSTVQIYTDLVCKSLQPDIPSSSCASDPNVQAVVSWLMTSISTTSGILSCLTAASWASLSDRIGRRPVLAISTAGLLASFAILIATNSFAGHPGLPGGFWFLIVGSSIYGLLGGRAAASASSTAYIIDCTPPFSRTRMLSLIHALRFTGMAVGPTFGSFLIKLSGTPISPVYFATSMYLMHFIVVLFVIPESLSRESRAENRRKWDVAYASQGTQKTFFRIHALLRPLEIAKPSTTFSSHPGRKNKDWSLTLIAISSGVAALSGASYAVEYQYSAATFAWSAIEQGYWTSSTMTARALTLIVIIPVVFKLHQRFFSRRNSPNEADNSPLLISESNADEGSQFVSRTKKHAYPPHHTPASDLLIAQLSLLLQAVCLGILPLFASTPVTVFKKFFISLFILSACGSGADPASHSLAAELYTRRGGTESGKLYGTLSVIQAISSQIVGPILYGFSYSVLVGTYPPGIFFVSAGVTALAFLALNFVKLPKDTDGTVSHPQLSYGSIP